MSWGENTGNVSYGISGGGAVINSGPSPLKSDDRPDLVVVDEMLSKALMQLDEELRLMSNSIMSLGGSWPTPPQTAQVASAPPGNALASLRERAESAHRSAQLAHELRERLQRLI